MSTRLARLPRFAAWLLAGLLGSCALWAMGQDDSTEARLQAQTQQIQNGFHKLGKQLQQLGQNRTQADQTLIRQGQTIQKQIETIEQGQAQLGVQLARLQNESEQQIAQLQHSKRQLAWALWGLAALAVLMLVLLWRQRTARNNPRGLPPAPAAPTRPDPIAPTTTAAMPAPQQPEAAAAVQDPAPAEAASAAQAPLEAAPVPAAPTPAAPSAAPASPSATAVPAWSALLAADLSSTEQALAQAREGFMQPVRLEQ